MKVLAALVALVLLAGAGEPAPVIKRIAAEEAAQGVASDGTHAYAVDNSRIAKYRIADGTRVAQWQGDPTVFPHLNSCTVVRRDLVCASSNYPALPQASSVEVFDLRTLRHRRSHSFGIAEGSLTALDRHAGAWWAVFAHYTGRGDVPGIDNGYGQLVRLDDQFRPLERWRFPPAMLARMGTHSASGASWTRDGRLAVSGHDRAEIYIVALPEAGTVLTLDATLPIGTEGQAIDWDPKRPFALWSISRGKREMVLSDFAGSHAR